MSISSSSIKQTSVYERTILTTEMLRPVVQSEVQPEGFSLNTNLKEKVYSCAQGDQTIVFLSDNCVHQLPTSLFNFLCNISERYPNVGIVSINDMLAWECHYLINDLREISTPSTLKKHKEIQYKLDELETTFAAWIGWIGVFREKRALSNSPESLLMEDQALYRDILSLRKAFSPTLPYINQQLVNLQDFFSKPFHSIHKRETSEIASIHSNNIELSQRLRHQIVNLIDSVLICIQTPALIEASHNMPVQSIFNYRGPSTAFLKNYSDIMLAFNKAYYRLPSSRKIEIAGLETMLQNISGHFDSGLSMLKIKETIKISNFVYSLRMSYRATLLENSDNAASLNGLQPLALSLELFDTIKFHITHEFAAQKNGCPLYQFVNFMSLLEIWNKPILDLSDIPEILKKNKQIFKLFISLSVLSAKKAPSIENKEKLYILLSELVEAARKSSPSSFDQYVVTVMGFTEYPMMVDFVAELREIMSEACVAIDQSNFSLDEVNEICTFFHQHPFIRNLLVSEQILNYFEKIVLKDHEIPPSPIWRLFNIFKDKQQALLSVCEETPNSKLIENEKSVLESLDDLIGSGETSPTTFEEVANSSSISSYLDTQFEGSLSETNQDCLKTSSIAQIEQKEPENNFEDIDYNELIALERRKSLLKNLSRQINNLALSQESIASPTPSIDYSEDFRDTNPNLLRELQNPRKMKQYLRQNGIRLLRQGARHEIWGSNRGKQITVPRHPTDLSPGVCHNLIGFVAKESS